MGFDRNKFLAANKEVKENTGDFFKPALGSYIMTLDSCSFGKSKAGNDQVTNVWLISEDDDRSPGKRAYNYIRVEDEQGYLALSRFLSRIGYKGDEETFAVDPDGELETLVGTKVRMMIAKNTKSEDFPYFNIQKVLESPINSESGQTNVQTDDSDLITENQPSGDENTLEVGDEVSVTTKTGESLGIAKLINEAANQVIVELTTTKQTVVVGPDVLSLVRKAKDVKANPNGVPKSTTAANPPAKPLQKPMQTVVEETVEEIVEVTEEIKLEKGMMVQGTYKNDKIVGKVYDLSPDGMIVKILFNGKAYPCKRDTVTLIS